MDIQLKFTEKKDYEAFKKDVRDVFSLASHGEAIPEEDIEESLYASQGQVYDIYWKGAKVGGVVLRIDSKSGRGALDLFYIYSEFHSKGIGTAVWELVEKTYPETKIWELVTPYFEKRNIHFYVNKCGFHIVEFFCKFHRDSRAGESKTESAEEFFRFEKHMTIDIEEV